MMSSDWASRMIISVLSCWIMIVARLHSASGHFRADEPLDANRFSIRLRCETTPVIASDLFPPIPFFLLFFLHIHSNYLILIQLTFHLIFCNSDIFSFTLCYANQLSIFFFPFSYIHNKIKNNKSKTNP